MRYQHIFVVLAKLELSRLSMQTWRHAGVCGDSRQMWVRVMARSGWMCLVGAVGCCWCFHQGLVSSPDHPRPINPNWPKLWLVATLQLRHECWNACRVVFWSFQCVLRCVTMTFNCLTFHWSRLKQNMLAWPSMQHIVQCPKDPFFDQLMSQLCWIIHPIKLSLCHWLLFWVQDVLSYCLIQSNDSSNLHYSVGKMALGRGAELPVNPHVAKQLIYNWSGRSGELLQK